MKNILSILISIFLATTALGQEMYVDIKTNNPSPSVGEQFKISYLLKLRLEGGMASISHNGIRIAKPDFGDAFDVVDEGTESTGFGFGGFGDMDMTITKYSFILRPKKEGTFKISPLTFLINGEEVKSGTFTINVGKGNPNVKIQSADPNLFVRIELSKRNVYKGEPITAVYKVYTRYRGFAIEDYDMPMTNGLWKEEIKSPSNGWPQTTQVVNNMNYYVLTLKKEVIIAQKTGEIKFEPISITAEIGRSFWNRGQRKTVKSNAPKIKVKPLPKPAPMDFYGQVGTNYYMDVTFSTNHLKTNEPIDVKVVIGGKGNINQLTELDLKFPQDFEVFEPETKEHIKISTSGIAGKKTYNYLVIPRYRGEFDIPEITFSYFNVRKKKYITLKSKPQKIIVEKGSEEGNFTTGTASGVEKKDVEILNSDIHHIKEKTELYANSETLYDKWYFWVGLFFPVFAILFAALFVYIFQKIQGNEFQLKRKRANKTASLRLKNASKLLSEKKTGEFYEELYKAILDYISVKFGLPFAKLNKETIKETLQKHNVDETTTKQLIDILDEAEMARFSPTSQSGAEQTLESANDIINKIEKNVK